MHMINATNVPSAACPAPKHRSDANMYMKTARLVRCTTMLHLRACVCADACVRGRARGRLQGSKMACVYGCGCGGGMSTTRVRITYSLQVTYKRQNSNAFLHESQAPNCASNGESSVGPTPRMTARPFSTNIDISCHVANRLCGEGLRGAG